jgi:hypothetical protein
MYSSTYFPFVILSKSLVLADYFAFGSSIFGSIRIFFFSLIQRFRLIVGRFFSNLRTFSALFYFVVSLGDEKSQSAFDWVFEFPVRVPRRRRFGDGSLLFVSLVNTLLSFFLFNSVCPEVRLCVGTGSSTTKRELGK